MSNQQFPTHNYPVSGSYVACLEISDSIHNCHDIFCDTINVINNSTGLNEHAAIASSLNNYPNPFNGSTTVSYTLKQDAEIELAVFDVLGKKVATIDKGLKTTGKHSTVWDAENINQGIYLVQLKVNQQTITKKIIITK